MFTIHIEMSSELTMRASVTMMRLIVGRLCSQRSSEKLNIHLNQWLEAFIPFLNFLMFYLVALPMPFINSRRTDGCSRPPQRSHCVA